MVRPGRDLLPGGGDILILSPQVLAVGISQRTEEDSIDALAETVLSESKTFRKLLAFDIPKSRSFMHLDTVFTMVDRDKFTVHPNILQQITVFVMELDENRKMKIRQEDGRLEDILKEHLELDKVTLIPCGQGSEIDAAREQWSDGSNTLAIGPGEVVVYSRNYVTNRALEEAGIRLHTIPSAELSRGRADPGACPCRCGGRIRKHSRSVNGPPRRPGMLAPARGLSSGMHPHVVVAKSAQPRFRVRRKLRPLPCTPKGTSAPTPWAWALLLSPPCGGAAGPLIGLAKRETGRARSKEKGAWMRSGAVALRAEGGAANRCLLRFGLAFGHARPFCNSPTAVPWRMVRKLPGCKDAFELLRFSCLALRRSGDFRHQCSTGSSFRAFGFATHCPGGHRSCSLALC